MENATTFYKDFLINFGGKMSKMFHLNTSEKYDLNIFQKIKTSQGE